MSAQSRIGLKPRPLCTFALITLWLCASLASASAMEFTLDAKAILTSGEIVAGDAAKLAAVLAKTPHDSQGGIDLDVALDSPGGDLGEAMRLSDAFRASKLPTMVARGRTCRGACAVAFLGGTIAGATGDAISRSLEIGATLSFDGLSDGQQASVLEYAARIGKVDVGFLARLLAGTDRQIRTPEGLEALQIALAGPPLKLSKDWPRQACMNGIRGDLNPIYPNEQEERVDQAAVPMKSVADFRSHLLDDKYPADDNDVAPLRAMITKMPAPAALDLLAGEPLVADASGPKAVYRLGLQRGAGFYFDSCFASTDFNGIEIILADGVSHRASPRYLDLAQGFPFRAPLW